MKYILIIALCLLANAVWADATYLPNKDAVCIWPPEYAKEVDLTPCKMEYEKASPEITKACKEYGRCVWVTGILGYPGQRVREDDCELINANGYIIEKWPTSKKFQILWNRNILESGWTESCSKSKWPFE